MGRHTATLEELRQQRGLLDQAITALEILDGERPLPSPVASAHEYFRSVVAAEKPVARKQIPAATAAQVPASYRTQRRFDVATDADEAIMAVLRRTQTPMKPRDVMRQAKVAKASALRAKQRLVLSGQMVCTGRTLTARWALPAPPAKEAP